MTVFGLDESHIRNLVAAVSGEIDLDDDAVADRFARAAWSTITEPGDGAAGTIVAELGAADALRHVLRSVMDAPSDAAAAAIDRGAVAPDATPVADRQDIDTDPGRKAAPTLGTEQLTVALERWRPRLRSGDVERSLVLAARSGVRMLVPTGARASRDPWPTGVDDLGPHAPITLWVRGDPARLADDRAGIALVGARAATGYGEHVAGEASAGLVELGYAIVSGAAYGIDGMAHRAALAAGGLTFAFLAGGVDRFYPAGHDDLLRRVTDRGVVLSELPCGAAPTKWRFLQRNRLIAACSSATVVVEAGARSGSLNTAGHAAALGRPLGAVPGPVTSPASAGCHRLLREYDAVCVTNARQIAELVEPLESARSADTSRDSADTVRVLDALSTRTPHAVGDVAAQAGLAIGTVLSVLGTLEVDARVREDAAGWVAIPRRR